MTPFIRLSGVAMTYPGPPPVNALLPTDLTVTNGEFVAVVGPSGSGKSTFLNIVGLLDRPTQGTYELDGVDVSSLSERDRTALRGSHLGFVFQAFHLLPYRSASDNVALPLIYSAVSRRERTETSHQALARVGMSHRLHALPVTLSGGEKQRVAIARALVHRPRLLLCDEPTGNLDSATAQDLLQLLDELHADGLTLMMITHDSDVAARAQRTVTIKDGQLHG